MDSRDEILRKIRSVRIEVNADKETDTSYVQDEIYQPVNELLSTFITEFEAIAGKCVLVDNQQDLIEKIISLLREKGIQQVYVEDESLRNYLKHADLPVFDSGNFPENMVCGITACEFLIARTGSVMISTGAGSGRKAHVFPPIHMIIADENQLVKFPQDAIVALKEKYQNQLPSQISTITGPSRTADIEKTLVMGAHGPKELIIFVRRNNQLNQQP